MHYIGFFENTMRMHTLHVNANAQGKAVSDYGDDDEMSTPAKEKPRPPVVPRRPSLPVKKDNTVSYSNTLTIHY